MTNIIGVNDALSTTADIIGFGFVIEHATSRVNQYSFYGLGNPDGGKCDS